MKYEHFLIISPQTFDVSGSHIPMETVKKINYIYI